MAYEVFKDAWCLVAMRGDSDGWVVDCCEKMAREVEHYGLHLEDLFNPGDPLPDGAGLHVWEGDITMSGDEYEADVSYAGSWRRARAAEVIAFSQGRLRTPKREG